MNPPDLIVIGCSLGGMRALETILAAFPKDFQTPIVVAQHRHRASNDSLPSHFRRATQLCVVDAEDKQWIKPNCVYFAPANYHLLVERGEFNLSTEGAVLYSRPSIDVLFESAADAYRDRLVAVILTGANSDGANGIRRVKSAGGFVIAQDPKTAEAVEMPQSAIDTGRVDRILPLDRIGPYLVELSHPKKSTVKAGRA